MTEAELKAKIIEQTQVWYLLGCDAFKIQPKELTIEFGLRGATAGLAYPEENKIKYHLGIAMENQDEFVSMTVPHEVAHLIANAYFRKNCGHNTQWQYVMRKFGLTPSRCHSYDVTRVSNKNIKYTCQCGLTFQIGKNLHGKIQGGSTHYCKKCKTKLSTMPFEIVK